MLIAVVLTALLAACGGETSSSPPASSSASPRGPLDARALERAVEDACADEVDARTADGSPDFLRAAADGDLDAALAAASYNRSAMGRMTSRLAPLEASSDDGAEALDAARAAIGKRRATWEARERALRERPDEFFPDPPSQNRAQPLLRLIRVGGGPDGGWGDALESLGVQQPDCGLAVP
ncbi:MAG: hypothetical protein AB7V42_01520 [Thermoleophilia bacterium]